MATDATGYALPAVHPVFSFPADHGAHPEFRIEWWYVTANLCGPDGTPYGAQWTLFRTALRPPGEASADIGWSSPQIWFAHAALTSAGLHVTAQEYARGGIGQAGVTPAPFAAWINDWTMAAPDAPAGQDALDRLQLTARGTDFAYDLSLVTEAPLVLHGAGGYSLKSPRGQASLYYSQPGYRVEGRIVLPSGPVDVTGLAWLDREWSSQPLGDGQHGWDWFALHFDGGAALMVYRLRDDSGPDFTPATWIDADGSSRPLPEGAVRLTPLTETPVAGHRLPTEWRLEWPDGGLDVIARALNPRAWMATDISYWEGPVQVTGSHTGVGYLEMTGYR
ncbi:MAG: iron ABC transporter permease [Rhodobacteraceae bacterium]|nr:iron ABC transporter permease [Paracoccaceae bacterium]